MIGRDITIVLIVSFCWMATLTSCSKILMIPIGYHSHIHFFSIIGKKLQERGHKSHVLVTDSRTSIVERAGVDHLSYPEAQGAEAFQSDDNMQENVVAPDILDIFDYDAEANNKICEEIHKNTELMNKIADLKFDLVMIDGFDTARCFYSIPYRLGVKYITVSARHDPWNAGIPTLPSQEFICGLGRSVSAKSTLYERISNLYADLKLWLYMPTPMVDDSMIARHCPDKPKTTFNELFRKSEMWMINLDQICLDVSTSSAPHYQLIAGMGIEETKPLPTDLEAFVRESPEGFVVFTLGSTLGAIPPEMLEKTLRAFERTDYRLVVRHTGELPNTIPENVKIMSWLPQNDLLAHPKMKVFMTHAGGNGQLEALYHSVPMISLPMFGDQFYNSERIASKGFGLTLDSDNFTPDDLLRAIDQVGKGKSYRENIARCSKQFRSLPPVHDVIGFWVEYIIEYGGEHLRPSSLEVPVWKMFMLDIVALAVAAILVAYTVVCVVLMKCCKMLKKRNGTHAKSD